MDSITLDPGPLGQKPRSGSIFHVFGSKFHVFGTTTLAKKTHKIYHFLYKKYFFLPGFTTMYPGMRLQITSLCAGGRLLESHSRPSGAAPGNKGLVATRKVER